MSMDEQLWNDSLFRVLRIELRIEDEAIEDNLNRKEIDMMWVLLSRVYDEWRKEKMTVDSTNNDDPFVPNIFPPENTCYADANLTELAF
jgi:hypothetical protein